MPFIVMQLLAEWHNGSLACLRLQWFPESRFFGKISLLNSNWKWKDVFQFYVTVENFCKHVLQPFEQAVLCKLFVNKR